MLTCGFSLPPSRRPSNSGDVRTFKPHSEMSGEIDFYGQEKIRNDSKHRKRPMCYELARLRKRETLQKSHH